MQRVVNKIADRRGGESEDKEPTIILCVKLNQVLSSLQPKLAAGLVARRGQDSADSTTTKAVIRSASWEAVRWTRAV